jgi:hypothetical protein
MTGPVGHALVPLEHVVRRAGLALRLTDLATGSPVHDGVVVTAWPADRPDGPDLAVRAAPVTPAGVAGFPHLPGLRSYEDGSTDRAGWFASPPGHPPLPFVVRVDDTRGDHLRVVREVVVPVAAPVGVALPRSPAASVPSGSLAVAATVETEAGGPAAWAVVELAVDGFLTGGVADARGVVVVPVPRAAAPSGPGTPQGGPVWEGTVTVRYRPADHTAAPGARPDDPPTLPSLLGQQPALVVDDGQLVSSLTRDLTGGGPVVVASRPGPAPDSSALVVRPAP